MKPAQVLIERFLAVFGEPRTDNVPMFLREFDAAIAGWDEKLLKQAGDRLVREAKFWPRPAEVNELCHALVPAPTLNPEKNVDWTGEAIGKSNFLIQSDMGRQAADEGWIGALHDHCRVHRTLPTPSEVSVLKAKSKATDRAYQDCVERRGGMFGKDLANLGASIMEKRRQLGEIAYGRQSDVQPFMPKKVDASATLTERSRRMQGGGE